MNRFDASIIWKSVADDLADGSENDPYISEEDSVAPDPCFHSDLEQSDLEHSDLEGFDDEDGSGGPPSSWSGSLRAQTFFVPMHYEANYRYPLIVWLHSDGFNENQVCHVMPHISTRNFLATGIRAPQACDSSGHRFAWSAGGASLESAELSVLEAINRTAQQFSVHAERIILAGYQRGGSMAMQIAMQNPELFSAAVSLGGEFRLDSDLDIDRDRLSERKLPMLWQQSLDSERYDEEKLVKEIRAAASIKAQLEIRQYRNDDEMNTVVLSDLDRWIMNHVVSGAPVARMHQWDTSPTSFSDN